MTTDRIIKTFYSGYRLDKKQQKNLHAMRELSEIFAEKAGINNIFFASGSEDTIVLESGHQPNFLPFPGVWKKAFILNKIQKKLTDEGKEVCSFFGFADQNLSTAQLLYHNKIPEHNNQGSVNIGFNLKNNEIWKSFNTINKPDRDVWLKELDKIERHYLNELECLNYNIQDKKEVLDKIMKIMEECYQKVSSFSDLNSLIFAKICREILDLDILFYRHSDLQIKNLFFEEWIQILENREEYNKIYNSTIEKYDLKIKPVDTNSVPFWYNCKCGFKIPLIADSKDYCSIKCPLCGNEDNISLSDFSDFKKHFKYMNPTAVARDMTFSNGMGVNLLISGSGGSQQYGIISRKIAENINFHSPFQLNWNSADYYISFIHKTALEDFLKKFKFEREDLKGDLLRRKTMSQLNSSKEEIETINRNNGGRKMVIKALNKYNTLLKTASNTKLIFSNRFSMLDLIINVNSQNIINNWNDNIEKADFNEDLEPYKIVLFGDATYNSFDEIKEDHTKLPELFKSINSLEVS